MPLDPSLVITVGDLDPVPQPPAGVGTGYDSSMRPFSFGLAYGDAASPFPDSMLIDTAEMPDRVRERQKAKASLVDLCDAVKLNPLNQQSTNYCTSEDTEVLTEHGWVRWPDYNGSDLLGTMNPASGMLEFQAPIERQIFEHNGPMIYSTNGSVDFAVTPDHRMLASKWDEAKRTLSSRFQFTKAKDLGWYFGLPHATTGHVGTEVRSVRIGERDYAGDDFAKLVSLVVSDGYAGGTEKTQNWVSFACFKPERLEWVRPLAHRLGFTEKTSGGVFIRYGAGELARWFRANAYTSPELGAWHKCVPSIIKTFSSRQITAFLDAFGDQSPQSSGKGRQFFSTSRRMIDDIQELLLRIGKRGSIYRNACAGKQAVLRSGQIATSRRDIWNLTERATDQLSIDRKQHLEQETYKGNVYCATVPNSTLITRRNGSILISGNCWANGPTYACEALRVVQNEPLVYLSPASVAAPIKNYRNVGGWGKEALEYMIEHGIAPVSLWPANAINRQYDNQESRQARRQYMPVEWWELQPGDLQQLFSALLHNIPVAVGYNWWSHEVCAVDLTTDLDLIIRNSWGDWGDRGYGKLSGNRRRPDDAVAPRTMVSA